MRGEKNHHVPFTDPIFPNSSLNCKRKLAQPKIPMSGQTANWNLVLPCCCLAVLQCFSKKKPEFVKRVYSFLTPKSIHGNSGPIHEALHSFLTIKDSRYI
jgi:hypothetical protein